MNKGNSVSLQSLHNSIRSKVSVERPGTNSGGDSPKIPELIHVSAEDIDPFLRDLSRVGFKWRIFWAEFGIHLFLPLVLLFPLIFPDNKISLQTIIRNRDLNPSLTLNSIVQWFNFCAIIICNTLFALYYQRNDDDDTAVTTPNTKMPHISVSEVLLLNMMFLIRQLIIATKYAYCSDIEYRRQGMELESATVKQERQVLSGWFNPSKALCESQLLLASTRQCTDLTVAWLELQAQDDDKESLPTAAASSKDVYQARKAAFLKSTRIGPESQATQAKKVLDESYAAVIENTSAPQKSHNDADGGDNVDGKYWSTWNFVSLVIQESIAANLPSFRLPLLFALTNCVTPMITRWATGRIVLGGHSWQATLFSILALWLNWFLTTTNFGFVVVIHSDFRRRRAFQSRLLTLLEDGHVQGSVRIDLKSPLNFSNWWFARSILQDFGLPYLKRLSLYLGYFGFYVVAISILAIVQGYLYTIPMISIETVIAMIINIAVFAAALIRAIFIVKDIDSISCSQMLTLSKTQLDFSSSIQIIDRKIRALETLASTLSNSDDPDKARIRHYTEFLQREREGLQQCGDTVETIADAIDNDMAVNRITIMGFEASFEIINFLSGFFIAAISSAITYLYLK